MKKYIVFLSVILMAGLHPVSAGDEEGASPPKESIKKHLGGRESENDEPRQPVTAAEKEREAAAAKAARQARGARRAAAAKAAAEADRKAKELEATRLAEADRKPKEREAAAAKVARQARGARRAAAAKAAAEAKEREAAAEKAARQARGARRAAEAKAKAAAEAEKKEKELEAARPAEATEKEKAEAAKRARILRRARKAAEAAAKAERGGYHAAGDRGLGPLPTIPPAPPMPTTNTKPGPGADIPIPPPMPPSFSTPAKKGSPPQESPLQGSPSASQLLSKMQKLQNAEALEKLAEEEDRSFPLTIKRMEDAIFFAQQKNQVSPSEIIKLNRVIEICSKYKQDIRQSKLKEGSEKKKRRAQCDSAIQESMKFWEVHDKKLNKEALVRKFARNKGSDEDTSAEDDDGWSSDEDDDDDAQVAWTEVDMRKMEDLRLRVQNALGNLERARQGKPPINLEEKKAAAKALAEQKNYVARLEAWEKEIAAYKPLNDVQLKIKRMEHRDPNWQQPGKPQPPIAPKPKIDKKKKEAVESSKMTVEQAQKELKKTLSGVITRVETLTKLNVGMPASVSEDLEKWRALLRKVESTLLRKDDKKK